MFQTYGNRLGGENPRASGARWRVFPWRTLYLALASASTLGLSACEGLLDVAPDDRYVDADKNPPLLRETLAGTQVDLNHTYDIWMWNQSMFGGEMVAVGALRWEMSRRTAETSLGVSGGLTGGFRNARGPGEAWYSYLQRALGGTTDAKRRILAGEFPSIADPQNSVELAQVLVRRGFELIWLADIWCDFVLDAQPTIYQSMDGWRLARDVFNEALSATGAGQTERQAALAGLARVHRVLSEDQLAIQYASQVSPTFQYQATYGTTPFDNQNRIWFRSWGFAEHGIHSQYIDLTLDATGIPDPRVAVTKDPSPPRGTYPFYAPNKYPSAASPLNVTSGVEAQFIVAELVLNSDPQRTVDMLNAIRSQRGVNVVWQPASLDPAVILDKLIDERRRTLLLEGTLVQDNRYWMKRYGKDLWHKTIPQPVTVGTATCHPLQQREIDNIKGLPAYTFSGDPYLR